MAELWKLPQSPKPAYSSASQQLDETEEHWSSWSRICPRVGCLQRVTCGSGMQDRLSLFNAHYSHSLMLITCETFTAPLTGSVPSFGSKKMQ